MPRATCRCGQVLSVPSVGPDRVICPTCGAKVRVRRDAQGEGGDDDGFIRFPCPCGRRLKVRAGAVGSTPVSGQCPDCGRIVPVPVSSSSGGELRLKGMGPESNTEELDADDLTALERWTERHRGASSPTRKPASASEPEPESEDDDPSMAPTGSVPVVAATVKTEAGLRVCPRCGRPVHLSAVACRNCGAPVPKR